MKHNEMWLMVFDSLLCSLLIQNRRKEAEELMKEYSWDSRSYREGVKNIKEKKLKFKPEIIERERRNSLILKKKLKIDE